MKRARPRRLPAPRGVEHGLPPVRRPSYACRGEEIFGPRSGRRSTGGAVPPLVGARAGRGAGRGLAGVGLDPRRDPGRRAPPRRRRALPGAVAPDLHLDRHRPRGRRLRHDHGYGNHPLRRRAGVGDDARRHPLGRPLQRDRSSVDELGAVACAGSALLVADREGRAGSAVRDRVTDDVPCHRETARSCSGSTTTSSATTTASGR